MTTSEITTDITAELLDKYEAVIGIECHVELKTVSKMFCGCPNAFGGEPNTKVCPVCLALPGALPVPNATALEHMIRAGLAFGATIPEHSKFDRKNYFYPDMPKNYQISQYDMPLTQGGVVRYWLEDGSRGECRLTRIHIEEDTGKSTHASADGRLASSTSSLIDFNRAGVPLMECVGEPDLRSADEAVAFVEMLARTFRELGVSDVKMEEGSLRCDANVSVRLRGATEYGTKAEIKNINSFRSLRRATESEIARQIRVVESGGRVIQETRGWDEHAGVTRSQRSKEEAHDYRYFPDPDLVPLDVTRDVVERVRATLVETPFERYVRYVDELSIAPKQAAQLVEDSHLSAWFDRAANISKDPQGTIKFVLGDLSRLANESGVHIARSRVTPEAVAELVSLTRSRSINSTAAKRVIESLWLEGGSAKKIVDREGLMQVTDTASVDQIVAKVLDDNPKLCVDFQAGKTTVLGALTGQILKQSGGKANPVIAQALIKRRLAAQLDGLASWLRPEPFSIHAGSALRIAGLPDPFVAPTLAPQTPTAKPFSAEVVLIRAPAAVGKTTLSLYLSAVSGAPRLDLSTENVGLNSFSGTLGDIEIVGGAEAAFHAGRLPIIIDALDEGRIRVRDEAFESFLMTTGRFIARNRAITNRPKVVMLGRPESIGVTRDWMELGAEGAISIEVVDVRLFDRLEATDFMLRYAQASEPRVDVHQVESDINSFFVAIGEALGADDQDLWDSDAARPFAGYAPVLEAVGGMLAKVDDHVAFRKDLESSRGLKAWSVIDEVLHYILMREHANFSRLDQGARTPWKQDERLFSADEQIEHVYRIRRGEKITFERAAQLLSGPDLALYTEAAKKKLDDHPFLARDSSGRRQYANAVIQAFVLARICLQGHPVDDKLREMLVQSSRQPLLWRSIASAGTGKELMDGAVMGFILDSFWADPINYDERSLPPVTFVRDEEDGVVVSLSSIDGVVHLHFSRPFDLYGRLRNISIETKSDIVLRGYALIGSASFFVSDGVSIKCDGIRLMTNSLEISNKFELTAQRYVGGESSITLHASKTADVSWSSEIADIHPFDQVISSAGSRAPNDQHADLQGLLQSLALKARSGKVVLSADASPLHSAPNDLWLNREWRYIAPVLAILKQRGLVKEKTFSARGPKKIEVVFKFDWEALLNAISGHSVSKELAPVVSELRARDPYNDV